MSADKKPAYRRDIEEYAGEHFGSEVEHLWARSPSDGILRRKDNGKWYAVLMTVERKKLGLPGMGRTDILNIKSSELLTGSLLNEKCIIPAYHMNKKKWLIPANPSICDLDEVFANNRGETMWTQKASFIPGDTVYIYIASPVREIRYECKVLETDLSCDFGTGNGGERAMRLKQTKRYPDGAFGRERLSGFGISSVRGARGVPHSLACALEQG